MVGVCLPACLPACLMSSELVSCGYEYVLRRKGSSGLPSA